MTAAPTAASRWAPPRVGVFHALWIAALVSNGGWMQLVAAQWPMTSLGQRRGAGRSALQRRRTADLPARFAAVTPELVGRDQRPAAISLNSVTTSLSQALGPAIGGLFVASLGAAPSTTRPSRPGPVPPGCHPPTRRIEEPA